MGVLGFFQRAEQPTGCMVCGARALAHNRVLWPSLIQEWQLSPDEVDYVDRQQGTACRKCGANLRSMVLAKALLSAVGFRGTLREFVRSAAAGRWRLLELNEAGLLHPTLKLLPGHLLAEYPAVDMTMLPYPDASFDIVAHSDTLEHIHDPLAALAECRRVLRPGGHLCYTVPIIVGRLTRSRRNLPPSYHGAPEAGLNYLVHTEFGADAWTYPAQAGFEDIRMFCVDYPAAIAISARR